MKSWIKAGLAGCLVLMAGLWGGSVRTAEIALRPLSGPSDAVVYHHLIAPILCPSGLILYRGVTGSMTWLRR